MRKTMLLALFALLFSATGMKLQAQVTIGDEMAPQNFSVLELVSNDSLGLRLPQLTTAQRDAITGDAFKNNTLAHGLMIYNITVDCVETWNGIKKEWVSLCGSASLTLNPGSGCGNPSFPYDGSCTRTDMITDPACNITGEYTFTWIVGGDYCHLEITDAGAATFTVTFDVNDQASDRNAILLVTSPCGNSSTFVYTQQGNSSLCNAHATAPQIAVENGSSLCGNGAVYLYLTSDGSTRIPGAGYVWTLNGRVVAQDTAHYIARESGKYIVYSGAVGCTSPKPDTLTVAKEDGTAPAPVAIIVGKNNGLVCNTSDVTTIYAAAPAGSGTIVWYLNGARTSRQGPTNTAASVGTWFAVVEENNCSSEPSNVITVSLDPNSGTSSPAPVFTINNGPANATATVCLGGSLILDVVNPVSGATYTWFIDNEAKGTGTHFEISIAHLHAGFILQCQISNVGCSSAAVSQVSISTDTAPLPPVISISPSSGALCDGEAYLTANSSTATGFIWYKDGVVIPGATTNHYTVTSLGSYTVRGEVSGCVSDMSSPRKISISSATGALVTVRSSKPIQAIEISDVVTFTATMDMPQGENYKWTVTNAVLLSGQGTNQITVSFNQITANAQVSLTARNACGAAIWTNAADFGTFTVASQCTAPSISTYSPADLSVTVSTSNTKTNLSITASGTIPRTYQWYRNSIQSNSGGTPISGATTATYTTPDTLVAGTRYYYCVVSNCAPSSATSNVFTVNVIDYFNVPTYTGGGSLSGKACFDIDYTDWSDDCGKKSSRSGDKYVFSNVNAAKQTYKFTAVGTVTDISFAYENLSSTAAVIDSITFTAGTTTCTVWFNPALDTDAQGLRRDQALKANLYVFFKTGNTSYKLLLTLSVADCLCCPGLLIPGGAYNEIRFLAYSSIPYASTQDNATGSAAEALRGTFTKSGKDLCYYYRDYNSVANNIENMASSVTWNALTINGNSMSAVCGDNEGKGVLTIHASSSWRLPNLMELANIGQLVSNNALNLMSSGGLNSLVNADVNTNGRLPSGSAIVYNKVHNLFRNAYVSSTQIDRGTLWGWSFYSDKRCAVETAKSQRAYARCVRSY